MRRMIALLMLLGSAVCVVAAPPAPAQPTKQPDKPKEPKPDTTPVLGKDTVAKLDVAFGKDEKQKLDVYSPKNAKGCPIVIFVHGGEWTKGDKAEVSYKPKF